jgi:hypothetical protein
VTNFLGFTGLAKLHRLTWVWSPLSNLTFLAHCPHLHAAILYGDLFQSISPILALSQLQSLQLDWNAAITNLPLVSALTNLTELSIPR